VGATLITGAAGDIGSAIARLLAEQGHPLALADHPNASEDLVRVHRACEALGATVARAPFDVLDEEAATTAVRELSAELGPLRGLVNNAGYQGRFAPIDRYPLDDARRVVEVNTLGAINVLAVVSRSMIAARMGGAIVNTASMAGVSGAPNMAAYSASKAAVIGLTKSAAKDLAPAGIRVNAISPAFIGPGRMWDTQVAEQAAARSQYYAFEPAAVAEQMIRMVPLRRYGSPEEVARVVAFLLSDKASYLTGVNIEIAGGSV
jgi:NAD(P)-dependent dehydrogenase (short-subunit alcohol dehydrogenase family)